jgi:hypothetical protein
MQERLCAEILEGVVNRQNDTGQVYLPGQDPDWKWINYYRDRFGMDYQIVPDLQTLLNFTKSAVRGYVVYDLDTPSEQFIAATICGLNNSIAVSPYMIPLMQTLGIPLDMDLRPVLRGLNINQIYDWAYRNLWSRCSRDFIGNMVHSSDWVKLNLTSYLQNSTAVYVKFEDVNTWDGGGAQLASAVIDVQGNASTWILPSNSTSEAPFLYAQYDSWLDWQNHREAGWGQYFIYKIPLEKGISANLTLEIYGQYKISLTTNPDNGTWTKVASWQAGSDDPGFSDAYTQIIDLLVSKKALIMSLSSIQYPDHNTKNQFLREMNPGGWVLGWFGPNGDTESAHVYQASQNGLTAVCSFPQSPNFSFHSKIKPTITFNQNITSPQIMTPENKTYITFVFSDGDALWSNNNFHYGNWFCAERGQVPLGWEMSLTLLDLAPGMAQYYYETKAPMDEFVGSMSGIGYFYPNVIPSSALNLNLEKTNSYLKTLDIRALYIMLNGGSEESLRQIYVNVVNSSVLFFEGFAAPPGRTAEVEFMSNGRVWTWTTYPVNTIDLSEKSAQQLADDIAAIAAASGPAPRFITVHVIPFDYMVPKILEISQKLNSTQFEVVTPSKFAALINGAFSTQNQSQPKSQALGSQGILPLVLMSGAVVSCLYAAESSLVSGFKLRKKVKRFGKVGF